MIQIIGGLIGFALFFLWFINQCNKNQDDRVKAMIMDIDDPEELEQYKTLFPKYYAVITKKLWILREEESWKP